MVTRKNRELTEEDINKIASTYHNRKKGDASYEDIKGFCHSANREEVTKHEFVLTPGRYVGVESVEDDDETFDEKMKKLTGDLAQQIEQSKILDEKIKENLAKIGYSLI